MSASATSRLPPPASSANSVSISPNARTWHPRRNNKQNTHSLSQCGWRRWRRAQARQDRSQSHQQPAQAWAERSCTGFCTTTLVCRRSFLPAVWCPAAAELRGTSTPPTPTPASCSQSPPSTAPRTAARRPPPDAHLLCVEYSAQSAQWTPPLHPSCARAPAGTNAVSTAGGHAPSRRTILLVVKGVPVPRVLGLAWHRHPLPPFVHRTAPPDARRDEWAPGAYPARRRAACRRGRTFLGVVRRSGGCGGDVAARQVARLHALRRRRQQRAQRGDILIARRRQRVQVARHVALRGHARGAHGADFA